MTLMQLNSDEISYLCGGPETIENMRAVPSLTPFSDEVCSLLADLSNVLLFDKEAKAYSDIITFAFFCRKANLTKIKESYQDRIKDRLGRGLVFHIAPSNVPINFAYSMAVGLLSGNACIVKVSSKPFQQTEIVCRAFRKALELYVGLAGYVAVVRYNNGAEITGCFSALCDVRVIWGGDETIAEIRKAVLRPRSFDIVFADRYSISVIDSVNYLKSTNPQQIARDFYNDTYLYDQNACSSPRFILWLGESNVTKKAKEVFWGQMHRFLTDKYTVEPVIAINKLMTDYQCAIELENTELEPMPDNLIHCIHVHKLPENLPDYRCAGGSFIEYDDTSLDALSEIVTDKYQTLSYIGLDPKQIKSWVIQKGLKGIDRIVPVGRTADFTLVWDGYDLILTMSRIIGG